MCPGVGGAAVLRYWSCLSLRGSILRLLFVSPG